MRASWLVMALAMSGSAAGAQQTPDVSRIADILNLPRTIEEGRRAGIPGSTIERVLDSLQRRRVPAADAEEILRREIDAVEAGGPRDNFGAFVNSQLSLGLRGRELADAIHAEQARRGMGASRGKAGDEGRAAPRGAGRSPDVDSLEAMTKGKGAPAARERDRDKASPDTSKGKSAGRRP